MRAIIVGSVMCTAWALRPLGHEPVLSEQDPIPIRSPRPATSIG